MKEGTKEEWTPTRCESSVSDEEMEEEGDALADVREGMETECVRVEEEEEEEEEGAGEV